MVAERTAAEKETATTGLMKRLRLAASQADELANFHLSKITSDYKLNALRAAVADAKQALKNKQPTLELLETLEKLYAEVLAIEAYQEFLGRAFGNPGKRPRK